EERTDRRGRDRPGRLASGHPARHTGSVGQPDHRGGRPRAGRVAPSGTAPDSLRFEKTAHSRRGPASGGRLPRSLLLLTILSTGSCATWLSATSTAVFGP